MATRTVNTDQLQPDSMFLIRGNVVFSRVVTQIDGDELQEDIKRETAHGRLNPITKPYTKITICNARVESVTPGPAAQMLATYAQESFYQSTAQNAPGANFRGVNKSPSLPWISQNVGNGVLNPIKEPAGELAAGLDVTLVMRVFGARQRGQHNGVSLDGIIVHEPVRYFTAANRGPSPELAQLGYTMAPAGSAPAYQAQQPAPVAPPAGDPFAAQPPAAAYQQPYGAAPDPNVGAQQYQQPYGAADAGPAPAQASAPGPVTAPQPTGGVRYDPNAPAQRQY